METSKYRIEGRPAIHTRRSSLKVPGLGNGEATQSTVNSSESRNANSVRNSQNNPPDYSSIKERAHDAIGTMSLSEELHASNAKSRDSEIQHLKDLLVYNLDLIQQQQDLLASKEKQITSLKNERDALYSRMERMERRMAVLKQKDTDVAHSLSPEVQPSYIPAGGPHFPGSDASTHAPFSKQNKKKTITDSKSSMRMNTGPVQQKTKRLKKSELHAIRQHRRAQQNERTRRHSGGRYFDDIERIDNYWVDKLRTLSPTRTRIRGEVDVYRTPVMYYVNEKPFDEEDNLDVPAEARDIPKAEEAASTNPVDTAQPSITIPSWRINKIPTGYNMEGTENLDDEIFLKRHSKPEVEEKRRKRWDAQRMRELHLYEKLQGGRSGATTKISTSKLRPQQTSPVKLDPQPDDVKYIEVCDSVAVNAFGAAIPVFEPSEFSLPWFDTEKAMSSKIKSPVRGRRR